MQKIKNPSVKIIANVEALIIGEKTDKVYLFVHGHGGNKEEAQAFAEVVNPLGYQVIGIDLSLMEMPEKVMSLLTDVAQYLKQNYRSINVRANSIGCWFSMQVFQQGGLDKALFVSPLLDMKTFIECADHREKRYYEWVQSHPIERWNTETFILRPRRDAVIAEKVYESFLSQHPCQVEIVENGEHRFHTTEQLEILRQWEYKSTLL